MVATKQKRGIEFDYAKAIPAAWDLLWADNMKHRPNDYRGRTYYLTARDVEDQVRQFAHEQWNGEVWGTHGRAYGGIWRSELRLAGDLQGMVRSFLLANSKIIGHNFGKGHVSGMRFRPVGEPLGPAETATIVKKAERKANPKPAPIHYAPTYCYAACVTARMKKQGRTRWGRPNWRVHTDHDWQNVTCKQCLNLRAVEYPQSLTEENDNTTNNNAIGALLGETIFKKGV